MPALHKPSDLPPPTLIDDAEGMERLLADLQGEQVIAFDTEADSFFHYRERVCLIQITVQDRDYLVDPLSDLPLEGIGQALANPDQVKVFHDGEYDVLILKREYGFEFRNLFDTRVASAALGVESPGLAAVVAERFGVELDKSLQRSNWSERPLSEKQVAYARLDTRYLIPLREMLIQELDERGRAVIVEGECRRLEKLEVPERSFVADEFLRLKGARALQPLEMQVLRELFILRDKLACRRDVPPFKILGNHVLMALARSQPADAQQIAHVPELSPRVARRLAPRLLESIAAGKRKGPLEKLPQLPPRDGTRGLDEAGYELHERLKQWRKNRAKGEGIDASLILNRHVMLRLAAARPVDPDALEQVEGLLDWQRELLGDQLLEVVRTFERDLADGRVSIGRGRRR